MAIKSRVHFRRGFDDNGFAKTILLVEPEQPFLGTTRLDRPPYRNVDLAVLSLRKLGISCVRSNPMLGHVLLSNTTTE